MRPVHSRGTLGRTLCGQRLVIRIQAVEGTAGVTCAKCMAAAKRVAQAQTVDAASPMSEVITQSPPCQMHSSAPAVPRCPLCDEPNTSNRKTCLPCLDRLQDDPDMPLTDDQKAALGPLVAALQAPPARRRSATGRPKPNPLGPDNRLHQRDLGREALGLPIPTPPQVDLGRSTWLFDDRTIAAMLSEAQAMAEDPGTDEDLREKAEAVRANVAIEARMRGVDPAPLPPADGTGEALYAALEQARLDLIGLFLADAGRWGFALTWPEAVERYGMPAHIARIEEALRAASPTA